MSIEIDHENRKKKILKKTLLLFAEQGYSRVTLQKIADNCGISRTTLYRSFHDKRKILDESIKNGEFHPVDLRIANNPFYSQLETLSPHFSRAYVAGRCRRCPDKACDIGPRSRTCTVRRGGRRSITQSGRMYTPPQ